MADRGKKSKSVNYPSKNPSTTSISRKTAEEAILEFFEDYSGWITPKILAAKLGRNYNTIRDKCNEISKRRGRNARLLRKRDGLLVKYKANRPYPDDLIRMEQVKAVKFPLIHGLTLYVDNLFRQSPTLGLNCILCGQPVDKSFACSRCGYHFRVGKFTYRRKIATGRIVSWRYGRTKNSLTIWINSSESPLAFRDLQHMFTRVSALTGVNLWENLYYFRTKQFGISQDGVKIEVDERHYRDNPAMLEFFRLSNFSNWFAQRYKKKTIFDNTEYEIIRSELHVQQEYPLDNFLYALQGTLTESQAISGINSMRLDLREMTLELRSLSRIIMVQNERIKRLEEKNKKQSKKLKSLEAKVKKDKK
ncbi:MAG: hypothetical protein ACTSX0_02200 [Promethearchaeota archaeon]